MASLIFAINAYAATLPPAEEVKLLVSVYAADLSPARQEQMLRTIDCESGFVPQQSRHIDAVGQREQSWGIAQIYLPAHPGVTRAQAMDNNFAVQWMADKFRQGKERIWTCWKNLYAKK